MSLLARLLAPMPGLAGRGRALLARLDAMPSRERAALAAMMLAALVGVELGWIWPLREQRASIQSALSAQNRAVEEAELARQQQLTSAEQALQTRLAAVERSLTRRGAGQARGEPLATWLARSLSGHSVRVVALRDLGTEELDTTPAAESSTSAAAASAGATPTAEAAAADTAATQHPPTYRHRYELVLAGDSAQLTAAVQALAERMLPLRIERVRLSSPDGVLVHATLGFMVIASERTWISL